MKLSAALLVLAACGDPTVAVTVTEADGSHGLAVAYQDGDGAWTPVEGDGVYHFDVSSGRYGVAVWCAATRYRHVVFDYLTTDELTSVAVVGGCPGTDMTLRGRVRNLANSAEVSWSFASVNADVGGSYALPGPTGTHDLVATSYQLTGNGRAVDSLVILRDREVGGNQSIDVDLNADPIDVETHDVLLDGKLADDFAFVSSALHTKGRTTAALSTASGTALTFQAIPADTLGDGDHTAVTVQVNGPSVAGEPQRTRSHVVHTTDSAELPVTLLAATDPPDVGDGPTFTWTAFDGAEAYVLNVSQIDGTGAEREYDGAWSPGYLADDVAFALPDLSDLEGWDARADITDDATIFWALSARTSNVSLGRTITALDAGAEVSSTGWFGSIAP